MVVEFTEPCSSCCERPVVQSERDTFVRSFQQLSNKQISSAVKISRMDILNQVSQLVPCVGCRHRLITLFHSKFCAKNHCWIILLFINFSNSYWITNLNCYKVGIFLTVECVVCISTISKCAFLVVGNFIEYNSLAIIGNQFLMSLSAPVSVLSVIGLMCHIVKINHVLI